MKNSLQPLFKRLLPGTLAAAALLAACGGGGIGSGGTGTSPDGVAVGTIGGFGSVFVGGVRCDDTRAQVASDTMSGAPDPAHPDLKLGQSVSLTFDPSSTTCKVLRAQVEPELVGVVSSTAPLVVAGQTVVFNTDASVAPVTVFDGYADGSAIQAGDRVEVHGKPAVVNGSVVIRATRVERKPSADTWVRVKGVVSGLAAGQFQVGGLTVNVDGSTTLDPAGLVLADGQTVVVWSTAPVAGGSVTARFVKLAVRPLQSDQAVRVEGPVSGCSATPCTTPLVDGIAVDLGNAQFVNGSLADVADGAGLRVEGQYDGTRLVATRASVRLRDVSAGEVRLIGLVNQYVGPTRFNVRGVPVTTDANTVFGASCTLSEGQPVGVRGVISNSQVLATNVDCLTLADGLTLDIFGALLNVDLAARTFNLSEGPYRNYTLTWDDNTVFGTGVSAATLANGQRVGLRVVLTEGKLLVKRMIGDPTPTNIPLGATVFGNMGIAHDVTSGSLTVGLIQMAIVPGTTNVIGTVDNGTLVRTWFYRTGPLQPFVAAQVREIRFD